MCKKVESIGESVSPRTGCYAYTKRSEMFGGKVTCYMMYRPCQNWLNLRDPTSSSSFFQPSEKVCEG